MNNPLKMFNLLKGNTLPALSDTPDKTNSVGEKREYEESTPILKLDHPYSKTECIHIFRKIVFPSLKQPWNENQMARQFREIVEAEADKRFVFTGNMSVCVISKKWSLKNSGTVI